jgi:DTW domain-containing protein
MDRRENQSEARQDSRSGLRLLILQHPKEAKRRGGTSSMVTANHPLTRVQRGLGWPNLKKAWSRDGKDALPAGGKWAVLYVGGRGEAAKVGDEPGVYEISKSGVKAVDLSEKFEGVVLIDGNWKEAKTLWWRNAWLLRLKRLVLVQEKSSNLRARRAANKTALSTAECAAYCLKYLGARPDLAEKIFHAYEQALTSPEPEAPIPGPKPSSARPPTNRPS